MNIRLIHISSLIMHNLLAAEQMPHEILENNEISMQDDSARSSKCKEYCSITAKNACLTNLRACDIITNNLTVDGVNFNVLTWLATILNNSNPARFMRSIIPFSSGIISPGVTPISPTEGIVMGFGSNGDLGPTPLADAIIPTGFSFTAPEAGTLFNLRVSVDGIFSNPGAITFTFTVLRSKCVNGSVSLYTATLLTATATTTASAAGPVNGTTGCGSGGAKSLAVAAGDRITIMVTANTAAAPLLFTVAFSAGLEFAPKM